MKKKINETLEQLVDQYNFSGELQQAMRYSLLAGGKRVRPVLLLEHLKYYKELSEDDFLLACALECIHTYSLIHDDLPSMDDDTLRRGKPTNHVVFGEATAILAGDALLNLAFEVLFDLSSRDARYLEASRIISRAAGSRGMIFGQVLDMEKNSQNLEDVIEMVHYKTGALFSAAIDSAMSLVDIDPKQKLIHQELGKKLGIAFQVRDDLLDVLSDEQVVGKSIGKDKRQEKTNFLSLLGLHETRVYYKTLSDEIFELIEHIDHEDCREGLQPLYEGLLQRNH